ITSLISKSLSVRKFVNPLGSAIPKVKAIVGLRKSVSTNKVDKPCLAKDAAIFAAIVDFPSEATDEVITKDLYSVSALENVIFVRILLNCTVSTDIGSAIVTK